jgi:alpha-1,3-rhamnosyl/mannosyltransferase
MARHIGKVATVHDYWHCYYPHEQRWLNRMADRVLIDRVVAQADLVVTPSAATGRDVVRLSGGRPAKVRVVPWGVDRAIFRPLPELETEETLRRLGVNNPFLLSLDVLNPRKNFAAVLEAVSHLPDELRRTLTLVGIGASPASAATATLRTQAARLGLSENLRLLGDVTEEELVALYSRALAFVYTSLYEGFGMPVLEAMACGCPVIASDRSSLPEVAGDAALLVDPQKPGQLSRALASVARDPGTRSRLAAAGRTRVERFTWRATAEGMLAVFGEVLATRAERADRGR